MKRDETLYLRHIPDAISKVESYLSGIDEAAFQNSSLIQDGVIRQIEIIGEATKRLSTNFRTRHSHVPWEDIAGMRDKLIHDRFGVDIEKVWLTAIEDLPMLKDEVEKRWKRKLLQVAARHPDAVWDVVRLARRPQRTKIAKRSRKAA